MQKLFVAAGAAALLCSGAALGQTQRGTSSGSPNAQIMQQYQQLSAERASLKADNERLKKEADDAKAELASVRKERDTLKARTGGASAELENAKKAGAATEQALVDNRHKLDELVQRFRDLATRLKAVETERSGLERDLATSNASLDACVVRNAGLYDLNDEVLTQWENEGFWSRVSRSDGFTRLKRTELENLIDGDRARAAELKARRTAPAASANPTTTDMPPPSDPAR